LGLACVVVHTYWKVNTAFQRLDISAQLNGWRGAGGEGGGLPTGFGFLG